jgi:hypothetical protein
MGVFGRRYTVAVKLLGEECVEGLEFGGNTYTNG